MSTPLRNVVPLLLLVFTAASMPATGQVVPPGRAVLRGTVTDTAGRRLAGALLVRMGTPDTVRADSAGRFAIEGLRAGRHLFVVRHPGYASIEMEVTFPADTGSASVDIPLEPAASDAAVSAKLDRVGFVERRRRVDAARERITFLGPEDIAGHGAVRVSQLFDGIRDLVVRFERGIAVAYGGDGRCVMNVWLEGQRVDNAFPPAGGSSGSATTVRYTGLNELIPLDQIAAVEIYPRPSQTPSQFQGSAAAVAQGGASGARSFRGGAASFNTRSAECGSLVIWTR
jgi:hypothetical protein